MKWTQTEIISKLNTIIEHRMDCYSYKLARYLNRADIDLRNYDNYQTYYPMTMRQDSDLLLEPGTNVIKSVIDSLVSKLANNKVRPFFTPVDGTFETKKVVRQVQRFFDIYFDEINLNELVSQAFRDSCIFDTGYIWVNPFTYEIERLPPYAVSILQTNDTSSEYALVKFNRQPSVVLDKYKVSSNNLYVNIEFYINIKNKECKLFVDEREVKKVSLSAFPIVPIYFNNPIHSDCTVSVVDELDGIQTQIDLINARVSATSQLTPANMIFIDENSGLRGSDLTNKDAQIYPIRTMPGAGGNPISVVNPIPFDSSWTTLLEYYINKAYDMIGISQLSAQSRKPGGLDSGVALQTMEDIESDRFESQLNHYIAMYTNIAKTFINVVPESQSILPEDVWADVDKWEDVKKQSNMFRIQYSAATSLSKDPAERAKQIIQMSQLGLIQPTKAAELMELPDLTDAYTDAEAMEMAVSAVINNAVEYNIFEIPEFVSFTSLAREICSEQNQMFVSIKANKDNSKTIESLQRLNTLSKHLEDKMIEMGMIDLTPEAEEEHISDSGLAITNANESVSMNEQLGAGAGAESNEAVSQ